MNKLLAAIDAISVTSLIPIRQPTPKLYPKMCFNACSCSTVFFVKEVMCCKVLQRYYARLIRSILGQGIDPLSCVSLIEGDAVYMFELCSLKEI